MSARFKRFAYVDADNRMTKFLQRCRGAGGKRPALPLRQADRILEMGGYLIEMV